MIIDVAQAAAKLHVVSVFMPPGSPENPVALNPDRVQTRMSKLRVRTGPYKRCIKHVTVGANSLAWLARDAPDASIPFLIPTKASDPDPENWTVYKIIPDTHYGFHVGDMEWHGADETDWHPTSWGFEVENLGDFKHEVEQRQYVKAALLYARTCAEHKWPDREVYDHSHIAVPHTAEGGRRTDPQAGLWVDSVWYDYIRQIRDAWPWNDIPVWRGGTKF